MVLVNAQARTGHALEAFDNRTAGIVLERNVELVLAVVSRHFVVFDVAFFLEDLGDGNLQLGGRHNHRGLVDHLTVADAGQHVGDRITHTHFAISSLTSWPSGGRGCHRAWRRHESFHGKDRTYGNCHGDDR